MYTYKHISGQHGCEIYKKIYFYNLKALLSTRIV